jgi:hypothetical protein
MELTHVFDRLWGDYSDRNPSVRKIHDLFEAEGEDIVNDHIAFRTLDYPEMNIEAVARPFVSAGYVSKGEYHFTDKHLFARHFELPGDARAPRVFISQLILKDCPAVVRDIFDGLMNSNSQKLKDTDELIYSATIFAPLSYAVYEKLRKESEYAAWFYVFGSCANHFTVSVNSLKKYNTVAKVNELLKANGFLLNSSGGEIKGTPADLLQQSSTMADIISVYFSEGTYNIPSCYYEFAQRYPDKDGNLFSGFIAGSADKIFESTNFYTPDL